MKDNNPVEVIVMSKDAVGILHPGAMGSAVAAAGVFEGSALNVNLLKGSIGSASALKMCYAAWTKGSKAMVAAILALAEARGVRSELMDQWALSQSELYKKAEIRVRQSTQKAWRFVGEMEEIAGTFAASGLPDGFHGAAAEVYRRLSGFKDDSELPGIESIFSSLLTDGK